MIRKAKQLKSSFPEQLKMETRPTPEIPEKQPHPMEKQWKGRCRSDCPRCHGRRWPTYMITASGYCAECLLEIEIPPHDESIDCIRIDSIFMMVKPGVAIRDDDDFSPSHNRKSQRISPHELELERQTKAFLDAAAKAEKAKERAEIEARKAQRARERAEKRTQAAPAARSKVKATQESSKSSKRSREAVCPPAGNATAEESTSRSCKTGGGGSRKK